MGKQDWLLLLTIGTAIPATLFPLIYGFGSKWWRSHLGRAVIIKAVGVMLLTNMGLVRVLFGEYHPVTTWTRVAVYILVPLGIWYQFLAFLWIRFRAWRDDQSVDQMMLDTHTHEGQWVQRDDGQWVKE